MDAQIFNERIKSNDVFHRIYDLMKSNYMMFQLCLLVDDNLIFILKDPQRLFIVEKTNDIYKFEMKGEHERFEYVVDEDNAYELIDKFRKRQVF